MLKPYIRKPAALGHHRAVLAGTGGVQADGCIDHGIAPRVVLIPERDRAHVVRAYFDNAGHVPPVIIHFLISAGAAGKCPPAVPLTVPPVKQRVAGLVEHGRAAAAAAELLGAQGRGVNAELADLLADYLRKLHLDLALLIAQDKGKAYVGACAGLNFGELSVGHGLICILICKDACDIELHAVLEALLNYRPEEGRGAFARVRIAEGDNYCVVSYRVLSENRALIVERAVLKDDVVRV